MQHSLFIKSGDQLMWHAQSTHSVNRHSLET